MGVARLTGIDTDCKGRVRGKLFCFFAKVGRNRADSFGMGRTIIIKTVAATAFGVAALANGIVLEQSNTVTWHDALHALSMLVGSLAAIAVTFIELPE